MCLGAGSRWRVNYLTYAITKYPTGLRSSDVDRELARAFQVWSDVTQLTFVHQRSGKVHIEIRYDSPSVAPFYDLKSIREEYDCFDMNNFTVLRGANTVMVTRLTDPVALWHTLTSLFMVVMLTSMMPNSGPSALTEVRKYY